MVFSRSQLQAILNHVDVGFILLDAEGLVALMNPRTEQMLGVSPEAMMGRRLLDLLDDPAMDLPARLGFAPDELRALLRDALAGRLDATHTPVSYEYDTPAHRFLRRHVVPIVEPGSAALGVLLVFHDDTEMHELRHAQQEISSMIVHDLRGPLTAVTASLRLLRDIAEPDDSLGQVVLQTTEISGRAVRKLLTLVNSLLDVSKLENGVPNLELEHIQTDTLAESILAEFKPLATEMDVALSYNAPRRLPPVLVDVEKIERVFYNLIDNAIKFTPGGGRVEILLQEAPDAGFMRVDIRDSGAGIPAQHRGALFDRYQQLPDSRAARRRGTGIGLAYCKLAVEAHGGRIWIEDNPDGGAIFAFTLPLAPD